jgi:hypothetical protein
VTSFRRAAKASGENVTGVAEGVLGERAIEQVHDQG